MCAFLLRLVPLGSLAALISSVLAADPVLHRDLPYAEPANARQSLDVYTAADARNRPVVIWLHGGGWQHGDKSMLAAGKPAQHLLKPHAFVEAGLIFIPINYRFIPHVTLQEMGGDVARAIKWVHRNIAQYGGDADRIFMMGHSAGAQLAALVCTDERYLAAEGLALHHIRGCVPVDGDSYYPALQIDTAEPKLAASYRLKFPQGHDRDLSSVVHIAKNKGIPPFLILCVADHPKSGTAVQSRILAHYLTVADVPADVVAVPGKTHSTLNSDLGLPGDSLMEAIQDFVRRIVERSP